MIVVLGSVVAKDGRLAEALAASQAHVSRSRAEPGCMAHAVHQDTENPSRLVFVEQWASQSDLWEHFKVPASRAFAKALAELAAAPPEMALYDATRIPIPGKPAV
jgi:quinol monooxygenase YgiN